MKTRRGLTPSSIARGVKANGGHKLFCESVTIYSGVIRYLILRLPNLVGRGQNRYQLIPALVTQAIEGYVKISRCKSDIIDVQDVATIAVSLLKKVDENMALNVASGYSIPVLDILSETATILRKSARVRFYQGGMHSTSLS